MRLTFCIILFKAIFCELRLIADYWVRWVPKRRSWAAEPVDVLLIYSSTPVQKIVAAVNVVNVTEGSPTALWNLSQEKCGGVTRQLIYDYFTGRKTGFAIEIADVLEFEQPVDPKKLFKGFRAPQSFMYLDAKDYTRIVGKSWKERA